MIDKEPGQYETGFDCGKQGSGYYNRCTCGVAVKWGTPEEQVLSEMTLAEARYYMGLGEFPAGSMGPKIQAAIEFVQADSGKQGDHYGCGKT